MANWFVIGANGDMSREARVSRMLHQTALSHELPPLLKENVSKLQAENPGWEYRFYDDADVLRFVTEVYGGNVLASFLRLNPEYGAARADLFRYLLLYEVGGVYLDIKSTFIRPVDEVLRPDDVYVLSQWDNALGQRHQGFGLHRELWDIPGGEFQQWHIIAAPGHPFLRAVIQAILANIESYRPELHGVGWLGVLRTTGPIAYTVAIDRIRSLHRHRVARNDALGLKFSVFDDPWGHSSIHGRPHYSSLSSPIVLPQ